MANQTVQLVTEIADRREDSARYSVAPDDRPPLLCREVQRCNQEIIAPVGAIIGLGINRDEPGTIILWRFTKAPRCPIVSATTVCTALCSVVTIGAFVPSGPTKVPGSIDENR